ncbi:ATP-binding protein [Nocardia brasiliensis]|uniref:AAA ATPase n=1 Tax=Nocardia brasiliensis (strain ATCC 700358 / HUJEG-1) TaxID=1133849 RepID=K0ERH0_NOCB7|nr:AAA ATPase [Nocardia brasiliensis ATCC 700358]OCF86313.1 ATP-binding protein [Nocardia brasiliensis]
MFRATAREVCTSSAEKILSSLIAEQLNRKPSRSAEQRAWEMSLPKLADVLVDAGLAMVDMLVEYPLPQSTRRADVVLAGIHPVTGKPNYVVVELKQWSEAQLTWSSDRIVQVHRMPGEHLHPVDQVRGYCNYLRQYVELLHNDPEALHGVAYLHNATRRSVSTLLTRRQDDLGRLFTGDRHDEFSEYLTSQFAPEPAPFAADRLLASEIRPRRAFLDFAFDELRTATEYSLLDNQKLAFEAVRNQVRLAHETDQKCVILVTGGPGSGKSMVAVSLLAELYREGLRVQYATGSVAITETMRRFPAKRSAELKGLFKYYRDLADVGKNQLDVLICDEAHRIRKTSTNRWKKRESRTDRPQLDELMSVARVPVFLLDENQVVRPDEVGTPEAIRAHAARKGYPVHHIQLDGQFRCGGSAEYDEWVLQLVGLRNSRPTEWKGDDFEVHVASSPQEMEDFLRVKNDSGLTARIAAGFCWPWSDPEPDGTLVHDVVIGGWSKPWNKKNDLLTGIAPPAKLWATDPRGYEQVGCVFTAQGFEYDWAGVILGPDIAFNGQRLGVRREFHEDKKLKLTPSNPVFDEEFERLVRNAYKVLLTRGMQGVVIYATDPATQEFITGLVGSRGTIPKGDSFQSTALTSLPTARPSA